jgi:hypothetical protein
MVLLAISFTPFLGCTHFYSYYHVAFLQSTKYTADHAEQNVPLKAQFPHVHALPAAGGSRAAGHAERHF